MLLNLNGKKFQKLGGRFFGVLGPVLLACLLGGCASFGTYNAATGRTEYIFISTPEEVMMGRNLHKELNLQYKFSSQVEGEKLKRLRRIGARLAQVSDRQDYQYHFFLIKEKEFNAFTIPGGAIYFFEGLFDRLETDDQIASVLAHEIGHCSARHTVKKYQAALGYDLVSQLIFDYVSMGDTTKTIATLSSDALMSLVFSAYSRKDEYEADRLGVKYIYLAGYDLNAITDTLDILKEESGGTKSLLILRSHPYLDDRIEAVKEEIANIKTQFGSGEGE